jgi:hypothetical protein
LRPTKEQGKKVFEFVEVKKWNQKYLNLK